MTEPTVIVNDVRLTDAQVMAVRVAVSSFHSQLSDPSYRELLGGIATLYQTLLREVEEVMLK